MDFEPLSLKPFALDVAIHESGFFPRRPHWNYQNVFSPFWRLYYDFESGHRVIFPDREVRLGPDRLILIPDHQLFHTVGTEGKPHFWIHFSIERHLSPVMPIPVELPPTGTELSLIADLKNLLRRTKNCIDRHRVYYLSAALLFAILSRPQIKWQADLPGDLQRTIRYIEEHYASPLYIADLARLARLSESVLRREFLKFRSVPPTKFILQVRVREAAHLLSATHLAVEEIAARVGFPNAAYLDRVFRRTTRMAPGQFRQQAQGPNLGHRD